MAINFSQRDLLLAPNERQALALWEADAKRHRANGEKAWETLVAASWSEFLKSLWEEVWLAGLSDENLPVLLNEWQERFLWIRVLKGSSIGEELLNLPAAAKLAAEAWKLSHAHRLTDELLSENHFWSEDTRLFLHWASNFEDYCDEKNYLDPSRLEERLTRSLLEGLIPPRALPKTIQCVGFVDWTPSQKALLSALKDCGVTANSEQNTRGKERGLWHSLQGADGEAEVRLAAAWLRRKLENKRGRELKVGLVVPELSQRRTEVDRLLTEILQPSLACELSGSGAKLQDLSVGLPLSQWPVVGDALQILSLDLQPQALKKWRILLFSPFVGEAESESSSRALLWSQLCRDGRFRVTQKRVMYLAASQQDQARSYECPSLHKRLEGFHGKLLESELEQLPSQWATSFVECLEELGWPGQRVLDSREYQCVARWKRALGQFASTDQVLGLLSRDQALASLSRICDETVFQPKSSGSEIEVMGTLEALGLDFDFLWITGLHDGVWPAAPRPNPYLPFVLQQKYQIAHASPERELEFSRLVTEELMSSCRVGIVSYPAHVEEQHSRPSPLIRELPLATMESLGLEESTVISSLFFRSQELELKADPGPPSVSFESYSKGGTSLFKHQAACPFRAFAYLRLNARPQDEVQEGLNARERGTLLHAALENFWREIKTLQRWTHLDPEAQNRQLKKSSEAAVSSLRRNRPDVLRGMMAALELQRLERLLGEWIELELGRAPFEVVATEEPIRLELAGLKLGGTIDRVDRLEDQSLVLIDYKTGETKALQWLGDRPKEPQLPLYLVTHSRKIHGICFGSLKPGNMSFQGLAEQDELIPGCKASEFAGDGDKSWSQRQEEWRECLESLAREFQNGHIAVVPRDGRSTCRYCGLEPLCRVAESESKL